jgi:choloylglycine hydrolase
MFNRIIVSAIAISCLALISSAQACTDFQIKAKDGSVVIGRSMEFAMGMDSEVVVFPSGMKMISETPDGKKGISWTSKYGFLGVNALGEKMAVLDGMNEAGLSIGFLWFTESQYSKDQTGAWLAVTDLGHWMLGNFSTVSEVKKEIGKIKVVGAYVPQMKMVPGFHAAVHDVKGNNIVIEFIGGETKVYDNPVGVMTNKPTFDWQLTNLRNYVNLDANDKGSYQVRGVKFNAAGSGSGWLGMPGDWTPPTRFVRTALMVNSADPVKDAAGAVNLAEHILNANDIPLGVVKAGKKVMKEMVDYTQWIVVKDLTNKVLYFRSYQDLALKKVDMKKLSFAPGAKMISTRIESGSRNIIDMTGKMK